MYELAGQKSGKLMPLYQHHKDKYDNWVWKCLCDCGKYHFVIASRLAKKAIKSCGCSKYRGIGEASFNDLYGRYQYRCEALLGLDFGLTKSQFRKLISQPCHYCGGLPSQESRGNNGKKRYNGTFLYNGIDRINNNLGYSVRNSRTSCGICNKAKLDLTQEEFKRWIKRLIKHQSSSSL